MRSHRRQQAREGIDVALAIVDDGLPLFRCPRPTTENQVTHLVLFSRADAVEPVRGEGTNQTVTEPGGAAIVPSPVLDIEVENPCRHGPAQSEMAAESGNSLEIGRASCR